MGKPNANLDKSSPGARSRRSLLKKFSATAGTVPFLAVAATADENTEETTESDEKVLSLSNKERGQLYGDVFSSTSFKTVRQALRGEDYYLETNDIEDKKVIYPSSSFEKYILKFPCRSERDSSRTRGAVIFSSRSRGKVFTRSLSQTEGGPPFYS